MKYCVLIDSYRWSGYFVEQARQCGFFCIHVQSTKDPLPRFSRASQYTPDDYVESFIYDGDANHLVSVLQQYHPVAVIPCLESGVRLADLLSKKLGIKANSTNLSVARTDKYEMTEALKRHGIPTVKYFKSDDCNFILDWIDDNTIYPVVIKPLSSGGTDGVVVCNNESDVQKAFAELIQVTSNLFGRSNTEVLVQSYLDGTEYIVNSASCDGRHYVTDVWECKKRRVNGTMIYDREQLIASDSEVVSILSNYLFNVLNALGIRYGAAHTEIMLTDNGPILIETGARVGGNVMPNVHNNCFRLNQAELSIYSYLRPDLFAEKTQNPYQIDKWLLHVLLTTELNGVITGLPLQDTVKTLASYYHHSLSVKIGDQVKPTYDLLSKPGDVWLAHRDPGIIEQDYKLLTTNLAPNGLIVVAEELHGTKLPNKLQSINPYSCHPVLSVMNALNELPLKFPDAISLASGRPADQFCQADSLVVTSLKTFQSHYNLSDEEKNKLLGQYGPTAGFIKPAIAQHLLVDEDIDVKPENIIVTVGFQEAIALCMMTLFGENDVLLVPDPVFIGITGIARLLNCEIKGFPLPERFNLDALNQAAQQVRATGKMPKAVYIIPDFSNPQGTCLSLEERKALLLWAETNGVVIFEDNAYSQFRYEGDKIPSIKALDFGSSVIYLGTFAKTLYPGLRMGYVVAEQFVADEQDRSVRLSEKLAQVKSFVSVNTPALPQAIVAGVLIENGFSLKKYNQEKIDFYRRNRDHMLRCLEQSFKGMNESVQITWNVPQGGFFITVTLPILFTQQNMMDCAEKYSVIVFPVSSLSLSMEPSNQVRLAFTNVTKEQIEIAIKNFSEYIRQQLKAEAHNTSTTVHSLLFQASSNTSDLAEFCPDVTSEFF